MTQKTSIQIWPIMALIVLGAGLRVARHLGWLPLPPNVAPVNSLALLAATFLPRRWGWAVPLGLMAASDLAIGVYDWRIMATVYVAFGVSFLWGRSLSKRWAWKKLFGLSLAGSAVFFLLTNAAVWAWAGYYPHTITGLSAAYVSGLPFFRNTVIGDLGYAVVFFGLARLFMLSFSWSRQLARPSING